MTARIGALRRWISRAGRVAAFLAFAAGAVFLMYWLAGGMARKVSSESAANHALTAPADLRTALARLVAIPVTESAVGTVRAVHETSIGSKLLARVMAVNLKAGEKVKAGDVLVRLDDTDLRAKLQQAEAAVASAEAVQGQAATDEKRYAQLVKTNTVSRQQYDAAVAVLRTADADLKRVQAAVNEVQASLDWATVRAPSDAVVIDKRVDVGDMVSPGQILVTLFDPKHMQLVASVRESLTHRLRLGQTIGVQLERFDHQCAGTVSEIVPEAQSASRAFQVKVSGPCPEGIYSGMFGRIFIPLDMEQVLVIPLAAVRDIGQLQQVDVVEQGRVDRRSVRLGRTIPADEVKALADLGDADRYVEVLSGLREGEQVVLPGRSETREGSRD